MNEWTKRQRKNKKNGKTRNECKKNKTMNEKYKWINKQMMEQKKNEESGEETKQTKEQQMNREMNEWKS